MWMYYSWILSLSIFPLNGAFYAIKGSFVPSKVVFMPLMVVFALCIIGSMKQKNNI